MGLEIWDFSSFYGQQNRNELILILFERILQESDNNRATYCTSGPALGISSGVRAALTIEHLPAL